MAPRKEATARLAELLDAGTAVFSARGFRRARMEEVADAAGVSPGNLYRYVAGKDALFRLVLERAIEGPAWPLPAGPFPLAGPSAGATVRWVGRRLDFSDFPRMEAALVGRRRRDAGEELAEIMEELYAVVHRTRHAVRVIERSAPDMPELAAMFLGVRRELFGRMTRYIASRVRRGQFQAVVSPAATARLLIEATVWAGNRRLDDPDPTTIVPDEEALAALVELAQRTLIAEPKGVGK